MRSQTSCIKFIAAVIVCVCFIALIPLITAKAATITYTSGSNAPVTGPAFMGAPQNTKEYPVEINLWSRDKNGDGIYPRGTGGYATIDKY